MEGFLGMPDGWLEALNRNADLESSFDELEDETHWFSETLRGRIRSLQFRPVEAEEHFATAEERSSLNEIPEQLMHHIYARDHQFFVSSPPRPRPDSNQRAMATLVEGDWILERLCRLMRLQNARNALYHGDYDSGKQAFAAMAVEPKRKNSGRLLALAGLALCEWNLGDQASSIRRLESVGWHVLQDEYVLNRVQYAARLAAIYEYVDHPKEATAWDDYLEREDCSLDTKEAFRARSDFILARCQKIQRAVLI